MRRSRGFRSRTRNKLKGGRFSIAEALQIFKKGDKVRLAINPSVHSGMPHPRYKGRLGEVLASRGRSFIVGVKDGGLIKKFTCRPEHLKPEKQVSAVSSQPSGKKPTAKSKESKVASKEPTKPKATKPKTTTKEEKK